MRTIGKFLAVVFSCMAGTAVAQQQISLPPPRPPQVWLDPSLKQQPIVLRDVAIDIRIQGFVATTRLDLTFYNPNSRVLEGEFVFPLAEGQSITGYALDVNGQLRQGVVVEKETARVAYESTVRRGIDPGLAELTQGNVFRTRLYPLPANGTKRVQIAFDQPMLDAGANWRYVLPLQFDQAAKTFKVHAEALRSEVAPRANPENALTFEHWREGFVADLERTDFKPGRELAFDVPKPKDAVVVFSVPDRLEPSRQRFAAQVQSAPPARREPAAHPRRVALWYDASGSAGDRDRARELDFLAAWFAAIGDTMVDLVAFRNDADPVRTFAIRGGDSSELRRAIEALPLDGGSSYGAIAVGATKPDLVIVVGDGLTNFAGAEPALAGVPRLVFVHAAQRFDAARLGRWAQRYGGQAINLANVDRAAALAQANSPRWQLQSATVKRGECADLAPRAPQPAGATFSLYGACTAGAQLDLVFGDGAGTTLARTVTLGDSPTITQGKVLDPERGAFVERLWAVARIADLSNDEKKDNAAIVALAKKYSVVTEGTSMLVLDRIEDYVRYEVEPREADLAAEYRRLLAAKPKTPPEDAQRAEHLRQVIARWTEFKAWHEERHPWLETVLAPLAEGEALAWTNLASLDVAGSRPAEAAGLAKQARALASRWTKEGAQPDSRTAWEREAADVMLKVDALHQARLALPPDVLAVADKKKGRGVRQNAPADDALEVAETPVARESSAPPPPPAMAAPAVRERAAAEPALAGGAPRAEAAKAVAKNDADEFRAAPTEIQLAEWDPATPYLAKLRAAQDPYAAYLAERARVGKSPSFFLDCANYFRNEAKDERLALRVVSNLAEIDFESAPLLRVLAYRLQQWERFDLAVPLFEQALVLRGEEPQSRRDLALALSRQPKPDRARAVALLWEVASRSWDGRFPEIDTIAVHELNDVIARTPAAERAALDAQTQSLGIDGRLLEPVPVELRVVLSWDADNTDIDLWVIDPAGEKTFYSAPRSRTGGRISRDFTGGYGPEVFTIRRALPGTYVVKTHYFSSRAQTLTGPATLQLEFLTRFDTGDSARKAVTRRLENVNGEIEIGRFTVGAR